MNRPVKLTSKPQMALQSYLDSLLEEIPDELPVQVAGRDLTATRNATQ